MGEQRRVRRPAIVQQLGVPILANEKIAGKAGAEADRIDPVVREVNEMDRIAEQQIIRLRRRIKLGPQSFTTTPTTFGSKHGGSPGALAGDVDIVIGRHVIYYDGTPTRRIEA